MSTVAPTLYDMTATTQVVLIDGATISISVMVRSTKKFAEIHTKGSIHQWFNSSVDLTLWRWKSELSFEMDFLATLKANHSGTYAIITGTSVVTLPIEGFEEKARKVTALLASGEWVELTFASPSGRQGIAPPSTADMAKAVSFLSTFRSTQSAQLSLLLNQALKFPGQGWDFRVLGFRKIA